MSAAGLVLHVAIRPSPVLNVCKPAGAHDRSETASVRVRAGFLPLLILNSTLAYCQNLSNFLVTKHTSALTLQARAG